MNISCKGKILSFAVLIIFSWSTHSIACSSFSLKTKSGMIYGRNLDGEREIKGSVYINKRGVYKESITFRELYLAKVMDVPRQTWISKFGSITFNYMGAEFPDGGMNEVGLFFEEMTLLETEYPTDYSKPTMHMQQWIQYVLDNFATVEEVVQNAQVISIDGWNWHFFVADPSGTSAVIEFIDGKAKIIMGEDLETPLLCNSKYSDEINKLREYEKTGSLESLGKDKRFLFGKQALENYNDNLEQSPVEYGFEILEAVTPEPYATTHLSKIYDVGNMTVYFRTTVDNEIKSINLKTFDFSCDTPSKMLDVNTTLTGDVTSSFSDYTDEKNHESVVQAVKVFVTNPDVKAYLDSEGATGQDIIDAMTSYALTTYCNK